jgi:hypothetical protein
MRLSVEQGGADARFGLLMESQSSLFLSQILSLQSENSSVFFFHIYFVFKPQNSVFHFFQYARVALNSIFYLIQEIFYFQDFCLILFSETAYLIILLFDILCCLLYFIYLFF